ncbi:DUF1804 family protein [Budviciaceae bacterium CWB-B4]|uniref:DUF1804 family protein n=1 Tax=Limnobaculum xujianqingii TaxID=2738837 RepID=A0A9D7AH05_9GAMM|nr:DUF1804 family protein [Limnobaculum xujianqingii]MBK5072561.1 DUF1804 family protein [Limnobaculum xujianqingii]MBK5175870.1 DUF1804 family protein [Limnobaculum xujianqingii]
MAYPKEKREQIRRAYVLDGLSLEVSAQMSGVAYGTAQRWKNAARDAGDDWDKVKAAHVFAGSSLEELGRSMITALILQFNSTMARIETADKDGEPLQPAERVKLLVSLTDALNKAVSSSKRLLPETNQLATALEVIQLLSHFIKENYPQHLQAFADVLEPFGHEIERVYG